jgi:hypothetical protein
VLLIFRLVSSNNLDPCLVVWTLAWWFRSFANHGFIGACRHSREDHSPAGSFLESALVQRTGKRLVSVGMASIFWPTEEGKRNLDLGDHVCVAARSEPIAISSLSIDYPRHARARQTIISGTAYRINEPGRLFHFGLGFSSSTPLVFHRRVFVSRRSPLGQTNALLD